MCELANTSLSNVSNMKVESSESDVAPVPYT